MTALHDEHPTTSDEIKYIAAPTASRFHKDTKSFVRVILGPVGGGKTVACIMDILAKAFQQEPYRGVRRTRWAIVRQTYPELKNTTLKTWQSWVPDRLCHVNMQPPFSGLIKQRLPDNTTVEAEVIFLALDQPDDVNKLKSIEFTGIFINEVRYCDETIFLTCKERVSRYPPKKPDEGFNGATWKGIIADTNAWATTHWLYDMFDKGNTPEGHKLYEQPPAIYWEPEKKDEKGNVIAAHWEVNPDAENLRYLDADYYKQQLIGGKDDLLRVELGLERGISRMGKPVYPQFSEKHHVAKDKLQPRRGLPILVALDWGLNPAAVVMQFLPGGYIHILDALSPADESFEEFLDNYLGPLLNKRYAGYKIQAVGDPAGRGRSGLDKRTPYIVLNERGLHCKPAMTNSFIPRKEAVDWFLDRHKLLVSPELTVLREGFGGGYFYAEMQGNAHKGMFKEQPVKNQYSHTMDAVQYGCLYIKYSSSGTVAPSTAPAKKYKYA